MKNKSFKDIVSNLESNKSNQIYDKWKEAQEEKKRAKKVFIIMCLIVDIIILYFILNSIKTFSLTSSIRFTTILGFLFTYIIIDFIIYIFVNIFFNKKQKEYRCVFKDVVIGELINNFYDDVNYSPNGEMPSEVYNAANYNEYYNRYKSEDYIEGRIDNKYQINMAEVKTQKVDRYRDANGNTHTTTTTIFYGIFSRIVIDKSINSELRIKRNGSYFLNKNRLEMDSRNI